MQVNTAVGHIGRICEDNDDGTGKLNTFFHQVEKMLTEGKKKLCQLKQDICHKMSSIGIPSTIQKQIIHVINKIKEPAHA